MRVNLISNAPRAVSLFVFLLALLTYSARAAGAPPAEATSNEPVVTLIDHTPGVVLDGRAVLLSHYNSSNMLRLAVMLTPAHPEEQSQYLEELQDKESPYFHQFLTPEQWADRFGPTRETEQAIVDWAQRNGFTVTNRYNHRMAVEVEAPAGVIEKALHITINNYQLPELNGHEARTAFSTDRDPQLPASLNGMVEAVLGLDSVTAIRPAAGSGRLVAQPDYVPGPAVKEVGTGQKDADPDAVRALNEGVAFTSEVTPPKSYYFAPSDFLGATGYDYNALMHQGHCCNPNNTSGHSPRESSIAIAAFGDVSLNDVAGFHSAFPYLAVNVDKIAVDGGYTCNNSKGFDDNCTEVTMDTEWSLAMANSEGALANTARVVVYEAPNFGTSSIAAVYNQMAADAHARTTSVSFALVEADGSEFTNTEMHSLDGIFASMATQGWTLLGASGDHGATGGCDDGLRVMFPASDPNFVAVGGTEYNMYTSGPEVAWTGDQTVATAAKDCGNNGGGGTGGFSEYFGVPGYQSKMGFSKRSVPDISLDAFYGHDVYVNNGWAYLGGTSVSSPMMAGFFAQANAYLLALGNKCGSKGTSACAPIGLGNNPLYAYGRHPNGSHDPFYDITQGCNSNGLTKEYKLNAYCAKTGYDQATGWGSANMLQLSWAINWELTGANGTPYVSWTAGNPATNKWYKTNQTVKWTIVDYAGNTGAPGTGIAGEAQGWDSIASDPNSEPRGQISGSTSNFFYSGPQFVNDSKGCLAFTGTGCSTLSGTSAQIQGCHTVHVRGWNNQGWSTAGNSSYPETYGPICYDTVAPTTSISTKDNTSSVTVTLKATDPGSSSHTGSGVAKTYYSVNNSDCSATGTSRCKVYTAPFTVSAAGNQTVRYFSVDNAGNAEAVHSKIVDVP